METTPSLAGNICSLFYEKLGHVEDVYLRKMSLTLIYDELEI